MKNLKIILILIIASLSQYSSNGQEVTINAYGDVRLLFFGDDHGNDAGTIDLVIRSEWRNNQKQKGYWFAYPQYEYADLAGGTYERYAMGVGYTFNQFSNIIDFSPSVNWGLLDRYGRSFTTWEVSGDLSFKILPWLRGSVMGSFTERKDLDYQAQDRSAHNIQFNGYFGLKITIPKING